MNLTDHIQVLQPDQSYIIKLLVGKLTTNMYQVVVVIDLKWGQLTIWLKIIIQTLALTPAEHRSDQKQEVKVLEAAQARPKSI